MTAEPAVRLAHDPGGFLGTQPDVAGSERHDEVGPEWPLAIVDRLVDHVTHPGVTFDAGGEWRLRLVGTGRERHIGHEVGQHHLLDARLAERGKHLLDVLEEDAVRPDHQDTLILEREPMRVEQIGGPVQRNDRLAGTRTTLHDQHASLR